ncbi:hypothetical protein PUN28_014926 [Cardiocondyla obscurior]|uniref:Uncharacterized protein n=1 Tax=Cardiocondyla obscurior TaxID=286306 RepID=A0AAW2EYD8_9HYME
MGRKSEEDYNGVDERVHARRRLNPVNIIERQTLLRRNLRGNKIRKRARRSVHPRLIQSRATRDRVVFPFVSAAARKLEYRIRITCRSALYLSKKKRKKKEKPIDLFFLQRRCFPLKNPGYATGSHRDEQHD